jgi:2'-5' RNA ligase
MIRLFAAVAVPEDIAAGLVHRQQGLPGARWRTPDQLHLTLRFFGEVQERTAADLDAELSRVRSERFAVHLEGVGAFGEGRDLRAVWAGVSHSPQLELLASRCEAAARRAGLAPEKRTFKAHVTLAYLRRAEEGRVSAWIQGHNLLKSPAFEVNGFALYSSWTSREGSRYEVEREYQLG